VIKLAAVQVGAAIEGATVDHLYQPGPRRPFARVERVLSRMEAKEDLLHKIFGFAGIAQNAATDRKHKRVIASKEREKRLVLSLLYALQKLFIRRDGVSQAL
jgi:hypothetical protein